MYRILSTIALSVLLTGMSVSTVAFSEGTRSGTSTSTLSNQDRDFINRAAQGGMAEVQEANLVKGRANSPEVQSFAQKMIQDHTQANAQLKQVATQLKVNVPTELDDKHQNELNRLRETQANVVDHYYIQHQISDHQETVDLFKKQAEQGQNPQLKQLAQNLLPTLQQHLQEAKRINETLINRQSSQSTFSAP